MDESLQLARLLLSFQLLHICMCSLIFTRVNAPMLNLQVHLKKKLFVALTQVVSKSIPSTLGRTSSISSKLPSILFSLSRSYWTLWKRPEHIKISSTFAKITWLDTSFLMLLPPFRSCSWMNQENTTALRSSDLSTSTDWPSHCNFSFTVPSRSTPRRDKTIWVALPVLSSSSFTLVTWWPVFGCG